MAEGKRVSTAESTDSGVQGRKARPSAGDEFTAEIADQIESFLIALGAVARGDFPGGSLSMLLLEVSQLMLAGGRLGAVVDVVPPAGSSRTPAQTPMRTDCASYWRRS